MPQRSRLLAFAAVLACALGLAAQTFTPRTIRFEGAPDEDRAKLLELSGLKPGASMTKEQIEAALGKLADTGSFTELSYTVSSDALVIKLGSADDTGMLPVRFANFLWWDPADLERRLETEVPLFHGQLSITGSLTSQVEAALVKLGKQKGLALEVSAMRSKDNSHVALSIEHPAIVVGDLAMDDTSPAYGPTMAQFKAALKGQDIDLVTTAATIQLDGAAIFHNAGYLDATVDAPVFAKPRPLLSGGFAVDVSAAVHQGAPYRVAQMHVVAPPPFTEDELMARADLKPGGWASPMGLLITGQKFARLYADRGYLDAEATDSISLDNVAHTASYTITITPRSQYHLLKIVADSLPADAQAALAADVRLTPGVPADAALRPAVLSTLGRVYPGRLVSLEMRRDPIEHTVELVLQFSTASPRK